MNHTPTTWKIVYENEVGPDDEGFWEWWKVTNGMTTYKCESEDDAALLLNKINSHDRLTAEVGRLRDVLREIHLRAELAEADSVHMRGALGNIKDYAAKALNPEEPK